MVMRVPPARTTSWPNGRGWLSSRLADFRGNGGAGLSVVAVEGSLLALRELLGLLGGLLGLLGGLLGHRQGEVKEGFLLLLGEAELLHGWSVRTTEVAAQAGEEAPHGELREADLEAQVAEEMEALFGHLFRDLELVQGSERRLDLFDHDGAQEGSGAPHVERTGFLPRLGDSDHGHFCEKGRFGGEEPEEVFARPDVESAHLVDDEGEVGGT